MNTLLDHLKLERGPSGKAGRTRYILQSIGEGLLALFSLSFLLSLLRINGALAIAGCVGVGFIGFAVCGDYIAARGKAVYAVFLVVYVSGYICLSYLVLHFAFRAL